MKANWKGAKLMWYMLLLCVQHTTGQIPLRVFDLIGVKDKGRMIYSSITRDILVDRKGRIWYATHGSGVLRYDGYNFERYEYNWQDTTTLADNRATSLNEDSRGNIWVATREGLNRLDIKTNKCTRFYNNSERGSALATIEIKPDCYLVATTNGIWQLNLPEGRFSRWLPSDPNTPKTAVTGFIQTHSGQLYASALKGLIRIDTAARQWSLIQVLSPADPHPGRCEHMIQCRNGRYWLASDNGLLEYFPDRQSFALPTGLIDSLVTKIYVDLDEGPDGSLWMASSAGLVRWHPEKQEAEIFYSPDQLEAIYPKSVSAICIDKLGNLWASTPQGIRRTSLIPPSAQLYQIKLGRDLVSNSIFWAVQDERGGILQCNGTKIFYAEKLGQPAKKIELPNGKGPLPFQNNVWQMPDGSISVSWQSGGTGIWHPQRRQFLNGLPDTIFRREFIQGQCFDPYQPDILWAATARGLWKVNLRTMDIQLFKPQPVKGNIPAVYEILYDGKGRLWCEIIGGIACFDLKTQQFVQAQNERNLIDGSVPGEIMDIELDDASNIWVGYSGGLTKVTPAAPGRYTYQHYTTANGLPGNSAIALVNDRKGHIWVSSFESKWLSINTATGKLSYSDFMSPLLTRPHLRKALTCTRSGLLIYGSREGLVVFDPGMIRRDTIPPQLTLTGIWINNKPLPGVAEFTRSVILLPNENAITIEFSGIHLTSPGSNQYQYRLAGYDTAWINCPADLRRASYTNLIPGNYRFILRAANTDGYWSADTEMLRFAINPPYWQAGWFRFLLLIVISGILYAVLYNRLQQRKLKEDKRLAEQQAHYKSQFLANMSHEIRTPMNAILGLSRLLQETGLDPRQQEYVGAIQHSSEDLLRIVNDILDYSKIESGLFTFHSQPFNLDDVLAHIRHTFSFRTKEKQLYFNLEVDPAAPRRLVGDAVRLTQILSNLTGNAIKFTDRGGVTIAVRHIDAGSKVTRLHFRVEDTGIGIAADKIDAVFESFSQVNAEDATAKGGTGLGLTIAKQLVEQQGGTIWLQSEPDKGTAVMFMLNFQIEESETEQKTTPDPLDLTSLQGRKILLVEDTYFNQLLAKELLESRINDIKIDIAENGQEALEKVLAAPYDLVLMDVKMPVMDGLEATRRIRALPEENPVREIPVVGLTANVVPEELEKCRLAGMNAWITKPIQPDELLRAMTQQITKTTS